MKELPEYHKVWEKVKDLDDLKEYLYYEADGMAQPYIFEIDQVRNEKEMQKINCFFERAR